MAHGTADVKSKVRAADYTTSGIIKIFVGREPKEYIVHKALLCEKSKFFKRAVKNQNFKEGVTGEVHLPEDDPEAFGVLVDWMYCSKTDRPMSDAPDLVYPAAYTLADKLMMSYRCKDQIIANVRRQSEDVFFSGSFLLSPQFLSLPQASPLRRYYVDRCAYDWIRHVDLDPEAKEYSFLFAGGNIAAEVIRRIGEMYRERVIEYDGDGDYRDIDPSCGDDCRYHEPPLTCALCMS